MHNLDWSQYIIGFNLFKQKKATPKGIALI